MFLSKVLEKRRMDLFKTNKSRQHIKIVNPSHTHKGRRKHKMERKGMIKM